MHVVYGKKKKKKKIITHPTPLFNTKILEVVA